MMLLSIDGGVAACFRRPGLGAGFGGGGTPSAGLPGGFALGGYVGTGFGTVCGAL